MKRNVLHFPGLSELKKKRRATFLKKILFYLFLFLAVLVGLTYLSRVSGINIQEVEIVGNKIVDLEEARSLAEEVILESYFYLFPKTNVLFFPKDDIKDKLQNRFKGIKNVDFSITDELKLKISLTEREAEYLWCGDTVIQPAEGGIPKCYFMDDTGFIFDEAPYFSGDVYFKFYGQIGEAEFDSFLSLKNAFEALGLNPAGMSVDGDGDIKMILVAGSSSFPGPEIIFKADSDFDEALGNLEVALNTEPFLSNFQNKYSALEYIDLRFGNKVYYKFR